MGQKIITLERLSDYDNLIKHYIADKDRIVADKAASDIYNLNEIQERLQKKVDNIADNSISINELDTILV